MLSPERLEAVDEEARTQLRLEPRGLRRHRDARVRDRHDVGDLRRIHREGDGSAARPDALLELRGAADPADEVDARVRARIADSEDGTEETLLEDGDVQPRDRIVSGHRLFGSEGLPGFFEEHGERPAPG